MRLLMTALLALYAGPAIADVCTGSTMISTTAKYYWSVPTSPTFTYKAERKYVGPTAPWVVVIPGGPGQTSMGASVPGPTTYNWILTDPRTQGCNAVAGIPDDSLTSEALARDILALIKAQALPSGYVIYGQSYGTVVATILASLAESDAGAPKPGTVVLEGVNGRAHRSAGPMYPGGSVVVTTAQSDEWARIRSLIVPAALAELDGAMPVLGFAADQWGKYLYDILWYGDFSGVNYAASQVNKLAGTPADRASLQAAVTSDIDAATHEPIATRIRCQELWQTLPTWTYSGGQIVPVGDACAGLTLTPWDSKAWPVTKPIVYLQGERDPYTDPPLASYHFWNHYSSIRTFVYVRGGAGHAPMSLQMAILGCRGNVWEGILGHTSLKTAVQGCGLQADVYAAP